MTPPHHPSNIRPKPGTSAIHTTLLTLLAITMLLLATNTTHAQRTADGTAARLLERAAPVYPRIARMRRVEGWVLVGYSVTEKGTTDDITIIDSSIGQVFDDAARTAIGQYRYEPATFLDDPVSQGGMSERIFFILSDQPWDVNPSFNERYAAASRAIREGRLDAAKAGIDELAGESQEWLAEAFYLDLLRLKYARAVGDRTGAQQHLDRALVVAREKAPAPVYQGLLRDAVGIYGEGREYRAALDAFDTLVSQAGRLAEDDPAQQAAMDIRGVLAGADAIERERIIETCDNCSPPVTLWNGQLNRSQFSIVPVSGEVMDIEVSCGVHSLSFRYRPETVWRLNPAWGACSARIYGQEGTVFRLVEPPAGAGVDNPGSQAG